MKIAQLIELMKHHNITLPERGTGKNGRILARDLETALGDYFFEKKYSVISDTMKARHCAMRRSFIPMKAYRYNKLNQSTKDFVFNNDNAWIEEEKFNGWRIVITFIPGDGFRFWSGNISDVDFLPTDYTDHVLLNGKHPSEYPDVAFEPYAMDSEALCYDSVETLDGVQAVGTLDAVGAILGSHAERAIEMQLAGAKLVFKCFDCIMFKGLEPIGLEYKLMMRRNLLIGNLLLAKETGLQGVKAYRRDKKHYLNKIWKQGGEGTVLKNEESSYASGGRLKTHAIKVKRTMSGEIGDTIDAFITGWIDTPEWHKKKFIGGLQLSVFTGEGKVHPIATVTAMPDLMRSQLTWRKKHAGSEYRAKIKYTLDQDYLDKVVVVDGQELSAKHRKLMHARIDWDIGFRADKTKYDCKLDIEELNEDKF